MSVKTAGVPVSETRQSESNGECFEHTIRGSLDDGFSWVGAVPGAPVVGAVGQPVSDGELRVCWSEWPGWRHLALLAR